MVGLQSQGSQASSAHNPLEDLLPDDDDLIYEEEILRNPFNLKMWLRYIDARKSSSNKKRFLLYERALQALPGSYKVRNQAKFTYVIRSIILDSAIHHLEFSQVKIIDMHDHHHKKITESLSHTHPNTYPLQLWQRYLLERRASVRGLPMNHPEIESLNHVYERAMVYMHKMPRIWMDYLEYLTDQKFITRTRRAFDRALMSLPVTQHDLIWVLYLKFATQPGIPVETAMRVYRRYLKLEPSHIEEYIAYLLSKHKWGEAAKRLADAVNDETFRSLEGKSRHSLWLEMCELITKHPDDCRGLKVEAILRSGIRRYTDEVGTLWAALAEYFTRRGMFEKARDVYEEAITSVMTVRDFSLVFDALTQFEEALIAAKMEEGIEDEEEEEIAAPDVEDHAVEKKSNGTEFLLRDDGNDIDLRLARLESLMERRPELLSSVVLRQNPHNVHEWHKRAKLFASDATRQILTYTEAVKTVDPAIAVGKPFTLWVAFAKLYERHGDLDNARIVFEKALQAPMSYADDVASIWTEWIEMELRHKNFKMAMELARRATAPPARPRSRDEEAKLPARERAYRNSRLWSLRVDLEESLGTGDSVRSAYKAALDLKVATAQMVLNYAAYLKENDFFEESFKAYERGVSSFGYPHVKDIWSAYLTEFVQRYGGKKVERTRDLFKQACHDAPPSECRPFFMQYAAYEEAHGLARNAMLIFEDAVKKVPMDQRMRVYEAYLAKASELFGIGKLREVYEMAIEAEPPYAMTDSDTLTMCLRYAGVEQKLGEIDRARGIFVHASSMADPRQHPRFWIDWNDFEVKHGNEQTFREMLRIKRSVAAANSQQHFNTAVIDAAALAAGGVKRKAGEMVDGGTNVPGFVSAGVIQQGEKEKEEVGGAVPANPEDIELEGEEEEEVEEREVGVETKTVPAAVFGGLADRFQKKQKTDE